ncbi:unnamed protein product [Cladocopium goreaui]|uniref:Uncharacterized protein n=1 Tax=Cladocopium goreaui TaxID=2562237 RepID=A0A9P1BYV1_9DINO|nr:unnamed protein product [Cladocopium goreaui]
MDFSAESLSRPFVDAFASTPRLREVGLTVLVDHSGKLFTRQKCTIKDIIVNQEVLLATIKGANGKSRVSAYVLQKALLEFFTQFKLFPMGVYADIPAVQSWALKYAVAIKKLVSRFRRLLRRAPSSKYNKLSEIKQKAKDCGWCSKCDEEDDDDSDEEDNDPKFTPKSKGVPTDIEELSGVSTCSPDSSSCVSSGVSSAASDKLGRVIEQLKKFKIAQTEACPETKSSAGSANKTTHVVSTGGSDVNPGDHHQKEPCNGESRTERIARILKAAKEKRLEPQATKPTADDGDTTVLKTMGKFTVESKPFALKDKYVPAITAARAAAGQDDEEPEDEEKPVPAAKRKTQELHPNGDPWDFAGVRCAYMKNQKAKGLSFKDAKKSWDDSDEKRLYLKDVSVKELKRRKFIPRDCKTNPWAD